MSKTIAVIRGDGIGPEIMQATLRVLESLQLGLQYDFVEAGLAALARSAGRPLTVQRVGSMITLFFQRGPIRSWDDAKHADTAAFGRFHGGLLAEGVYWPPAQFEAAFISTAHDEAAIDRTIAAATAALKRV